MKDPITFILNLLGYEYRKPSLLLMYMHEVTHENWLSSIHRTNRLDEIQYKLYTDV
jgi:hypothetical protein